MNKPFLDDDDDEGEDGEDGPAAAFAAAVTGDIKIEDEDKEEKEIVLCNSLSDEDIYNIDKKDDEIIQDLSDDSAEEQNRSLDVLPPPAQFSMGGSPLIKLSPSKVNKGDVLMNSDLNVSEIPQNYKPLPFDVKAPS